MGTSLPWDHLNLQGEVFSCYRHIGEGAALGFHLYLERVRTWVPSVLCDDFELRRGGVHLRLGHLVAISVVIDCDGCC